MMVRELVELLQDLPDQEARVVIGDGVSARRWLFVTGVVEQGVAPLRENPDFAVPGRERAIEIA
jgi:hypothetical protein